MTAEQVKKHYLQQPDAMQLLIVMPLGDSRARARYYIRKDEGWWLLHYGSAFIGKNGTGKTREGDARTPLGELRPMSAFGIKPDPGSRLPYLDITPGTIACDEEGKWYNRIVKPSEYLADGCTEPAGEKMWMLKPEYNYGLQTDFNADCEYPLGSAIFVHCKGSKAWTGGCIALDERFIREILRTAGTGLRIYIL